MLIAGLAFLLFAGLLALNHIGLAISVTAAAVVTGVVFVVIALLKGERL